jgi:hypothetical protein
LVKYHELTIAVVEHLAGAMPLSFTIRDNARAVAIEVRRVTLTGCGYRSPATFGCGSSVLRPATQ